jgi:hypothetical protein
MKKSKNTGDMIYIAGPMTGQAEHNFPAFFAAEKELEKWGWRVISPARMDIEAGFDPTATTGRIELQDLKEVMRRDTRAIIDDAQALALLPGWERSRGSLAEIQLARWKGIPVYLYPEMVLLGARGMFSRALVAMDADDVAAAAADEPTPAGWGVWVNAAGDIVPPPNCRCTDVPVSSSRVTDPDTGGQKETKVADFSLIPPEAEWALAEHYGKNCTDYGGKYQRHNWRRGYRWSLTYAALRRHVGQWWAGEDIDPESGSHHLIAAAWHCFTGYIFRKFGLGRDDRPKGVKEG